MISRNSFFWTLVFLMLLLFAEPAWSQERNFTDNFHFQAKPVITADYLSKEKQKLLSPDDYDGLLDRGFQKLEDGLLEEATKDFESVIYGAPDFGGGYYGLGLCHKSKGDSALAVEYFNKAVKKDVFFGPAYLELGDLQFETSQENALKNYLRAQQLMPHSAEPLYRLGLLDFSQNKTNKAKRKFKEALKLEPQHFPSNYMMGRLFFMRVRINKAADFFTKCLEIDPENIEIFVWRAICNLINKKSEAAIQDLSSGLLVEPDNILLWTMRGAIKYENKRYLDAADDFSRTFLLAPPASSDFKINEGFYPKTEEYKFLLSLILDQHNFEEIEMQEDLARVVCAMLIEDYYTASVALKPYLKKGGSIPSFIQGLILEKTEQSIEALKSYAVCAPASPVYMQAQKRIAVINFEVLKDDEAAFPLFEELTRQEPSYVMGYKIKGIIHLMKKNYGPAISEFNHAIQYDTLGSDLYFNRASCFLALDQYQESLSDFEKVVTLKPEDAESWKNIGDINLLMGDTLAAKENYSRSLKFKYNAELFFKRGLMLLDEKKYLEAIEDFKKLDAYTTDFQAAQINIGSCLILLKEYQQAIDHFNMVLRDNPGEARLYFLRGLCYLRQKKLDVAKTDFKRAQELGMEGLDAYLME